MVFCKPMPNEKWQSKALVGKERLPQVCCESISRLVLLPSHERRPPSLSAFWVLSGWALVKAASQAETAGWRTVLDKVPSHSPPLGTGFLSSNAAFPWEASRETWYWHQRRDLTVSECPPEYSALREAETNGYTELADLIRQPT